MKEYNWRKRFLKELFDIDIEPQEGFDDLYEEILKSRLLETDEAIIRMHFEEHMTFERIAEKINLSRVRTNQRYLNMMDYIRRSDYALGLRYGKNSLELYDFLKGNKKKLDELQAKNKLLQLFNEMENAENTKISKIKLTPGVKATFKKLGVDNAEELLSFSVKDFALMAGTVLGDPEAKEKFEKIKTTEAYAETVRITDIGLSNRTRNALLRGGITSLGDVCKLSFDDMLKIRDLGAKSRDEVIAKLQEYNLNLKGNNV